MEGETKYIVAALIVFVILIFFILPCACRYRGGQEGCSTCGGAWSDNYELMSDPNTRNITYYYTDWCKYCEAMNPEWLAATGGKSADTINGVNYTFTKINIDKTPGTGISGIPTIIMKADGHTYKYSGGASRARLAAWFVSPTSTRI